MSCFMGRADSDDSDEEFESPSSRTGPRSRRNSSPHGSKKNGDSESDSGSERSSSPGQYDDDDEEEVEESENQEEEDEDGSPRSVASDAEPCCRPRMLNFKPGGARSVIVFFALAGLTGIASMYAGKVIGHMMPANLECHPGLSCHKHDVNSPDNSLIIDNTHYADSQQTVPSPAFLPPPSANLRGTLAANAPERKETPMKNTIPRGVTGTSTTTTATSTTITTTSTITTTLPWVPIVKSKDLSDHVVKKVAVQHPEGTHDQDHTDANHNLRGSTSRAATSTTTEPHLSRTLAIREMLQRALNYRLASLSSTSSPPHSPSSAPTTPRSSLSWGAELLQILPSTAAPPHSTSSTSPPSPSSSSTSTPSPSSSSTTSSVHASSSKPTLPHSSSRAAGPHLPRPQHASSSSTASPPPHSSVSTTSLPRSTFRLPVGFVHHLSQ